MVDNQCMPEYPPDGVCLGDHSDGVKTLDSMEKVDHYI